MQSFLFFFICRLLIAEELFFFVLFFAADFKNFFLFFFFLEETGTIIGGNLSTLEIASVFAFSIISVFVMVLAVYYIYNKRRHHHKGLRVEDSVDDPDHPILGANTIRDMIEMTTSGSGSGERNVYHLVYK